MEDDGPLMDEDPQLLPAISPGLNAALARSLRVLRHHATDAPLRERIDDVLAGRGSLRDLSRDDSFAALVEPLTTGGWQKWESMDPAERDRQIARSRAHIDGTDPYHRDR
jgi:hypothetical protein